MDFAAALDRLNDLKTRFTPADTACLEELLRRFQTAGTAGAAELIRLHELLLFVLAYPGSETARALAENLLDDFARRVRNAGDREPFSEVEVSGIAGTYLTPVFSHANARWLADRGHEAEIDWDLYTEPDRLAPVLALLMSEAAEDTLVEANVPNVDWIDRARGSRTALDLLTEKLAPPIYDGLRLPVRWELGDSPSSRTRLRLPADSLYCHRGPLIARREVSLREAVLGDPVPVTAVPEEMGTRVIAIARDASATRYRELHGFTHGDAAHVCRADLGRGAQVYLWGVPPGVRLPLRAYHCMLVLKNGIPAGYAEALSIFEHSDLGFNMYFSFRDGETAWIYAGLLRTLRQILGVTCFKVDPYQIGLHNEEAIESGAFWFYRKLGFRPVEREAVTLLGREERRMIETSGYRTPSAILRRLARSPLVYEVPGTETGEWDRFSIRRAAMTAGTRLLDGAAAAAKRAAEEAGYLRVLQSSSELRRRFLEAGSRAG